MTTTHHITTKRHRRRTFFARKCVAVLSAGAIGATLIAAGSAPQGFEGEPTGDPQLVGEVTDALEPGYRNHISAAKISGDEVTWAGVGADENTEFEIGSITKTFTAALFADAVERGEVEATTPLGEVWPDLDGDVAAVSLESIAMQRSGLPPLAPFPNAVDEAVSSASVLTLQDPHSLTDEEVVDSLHSVTVGEKTPEYSNYGFSVLGQALSEVTGQSYGDLVQDRIAGPLGLENTYVPESPEGLSHGYSDSGLPAAPWTMNGAASAGAIRSTAHDMSIWLRATRDGEAPGAAAAEPREYFDEADSIGWAWFTTEGRDPEVTWHNGATGGYRSFLGFSPESDEGIIVLSDTAVSVDSAMNLISTP
ncbi:MAG: serine hydrolase domain-containing protein [Mycobacteriaceae bacterium]|uniref:serine hydrolase domain-containing protein n=1 Tax=Corynebacterium sp. TaxID=1720 RepID=UPI003F9CAB69